MSKELDKLIEQMIAEKAQDYLKTTPDDIRVRKDFPWASIEKPAWYKDEYIKPLAKAVANNNILNQKDINYLLNNPEEITWERLQAAIQIRNDYKKALTIEIDRLNSSDTKDSWKTFIKRTIKDYEEQIALYDSIRLIRDKHIEVTRGAKSGTVSAPEFSSRAGEYERSAGGFSPDQIAVVENVLNPSVGSRRPTSERQKLELVTQISTNFLKASAGDMTAINYFRSQRPQEFLSQIMFVDLMNYILKEMDSGSAPYLFEYFLALLFGGVVKGKEKTKAGKMGAADFSFEGGKLGSAKFYSSAKDITQAIGGFEPRTPIWYVVGIKIQDVSQVADTKKTGKASWTGSPDPNKIVGAAIYYFPVKMKRDGTFVGGKGYTENIDTTSDGKSIVLDKLVVKDAHVGNVMLASVPTESFKEMLESSVDKIGGTLSMIYDVFKIMIESMQASKTQTKTYIASGNITTGNQAFENLTKAEDQYSQLVTLLQADNPNLKSYGEKVTSEPGKPRKISESKSSLDQLIEAIAKQLLLKIT